MSLTAYVGICLLLFLGGLFLGRFLNRCVLRLCQHFEVFPAWKHVFEREPRKGFYPQARWYHRLPVIGTREIVCRSPYTGRRVLPREPWLEVLNGFLVVLTFVCTFPPEIWGGLNSVTVVSPLWAGNLFGWEQNLSPLFLIGRFVYFLILVEALFVATFIDFDLWIIPDGVTVPAMWAGVIGQFLGVGFFLTPLWFQDPNLLGIFQSEFPILQHWPVTGWLPQWIFYNHYWHSLAVSAAGFIVGGGIVWAVRIIGGLVLGREAMGFGDVILMAMIGTFIGWQAVIVVFFIAPVMALGVLLLISLLRFFSLIRLPPELPYGPYLSLATLVVLFGWRFLWPYLEKIFSMGPLLLFLGVLMLILLASTLLLLQGVKRLLGIKPWEEEQVSYWRAADQLHYFAGENSNRQQGLWKQQEWPGISAGRGQLSEQSWKNSGR